MNIIAIDPGKTTGFCYATYDESNKRVLYYPFQMVDEVDDLWRRLHLFKPRYIIIEDFEYRNQSRAGLELFPVQLIGVANLYALVADHQCAIYVQKAAQGKSYYTDSVLKSKDLYVRGIPHAMDASRHLLQWLTFGAGYQLVENTGADFAELVDKPPFPG